MKSQVTGKDKHLYPLFKKVESAWEDHKQNIPETLLRHTEDKAIPDSQYSFTEGKTCLTNLVDFYNRVTLSVHKEGLQMSFI